MSNFIGETKIQVFELCHNGKSMFREFHDEIKQDGNLFSNLASAIAIVEASCELRPKRLPKTRFRKLEISKVKCKVYEAKSGSIRIYLFHDEGNGRVIVTGGKKDDQKEDIESLKTTIKAYYGE